MILVDTPECGRAWSPVPGGRAIHTGDAVTSCPMSRKDAEGLSCRFRPRERWLRSGQVIHWPSFMQSAGKNSLSFLPALNEPPGMGSLTSTTPVISNTWLPWTQGGYIQPHSAQRPLYTSTADLASSRLTEIDRKPKEAKQNHFCLFHIASVWCVRHLWLRIGESVSGTQTLGSHSTLTSRRWSRAKLSPLYRVRK